LQAESPRPEVSVRHAVLAAALAFGPHLSVVRPPIRALSRAVMTLLDRRRQAVDAGR
jgi:hypothetical protein